MTAILANIAVIIAAQVFVTVVVTLTRFVNARKKIGASNNDTRPTGQA